MRPASWRSRASRRWPTTGRPTTPCRRRISGREDIPYYGWHYPPAFLLVAAALAALPYLGALLVYQAATLAAYLAVVRRIAGRPEAWLPALAFPAVFVNVTHGHNGFITAALLGGALLVLDRRPLLAGALIGCLAYKPQLGLLVPLVLAVTGRWRTIAAAAATVLAIAGLTWVLFGADVFVAFWHSLPMTQRVILEGAPGFHKIQSVYAALRQLGVPGTLANAAQMATTLRVAAALVALWRSAAAFELKAAALLIGCVLATPYVLDYDLMVLAPAIAFLAVHGLRQGFAPWEAQPARGAVGAAAGRAPARRADRRVADPARCCWPRSPSSCTAPVSCRPRSGSSHIASVRQPSRRRRHPPSDCRR